MLRYVSPEFGTSTLQPISGNRYRVTELTGLALTNRPGFRTLQKPLTNRDADGGIETANTNTMHKAAIAELLGITESAVDQLDQPTLKNRLQGIKDLAAKATTYENELTALKNREADEFIARHDKVIPKKDTVREHLKKTFLANRQTAEDLVAGYSEDDGEKLTPEQKRRAEARPLHNRETAKGPEGDAVLKNRELERAAKIRNRCNAICEERRIAGKAVDFNSAWSAAESEFPEA